MSVSNSKRGQFTPLAAAFDAAGGFEGTRSVITVKCPLVRQPDNAGPVVIAILEPTVAQLDEYSRAMIVLQDKLRALALREQRLQNLSESVDAEAVGEASGKVDEDPEVLADAKDMRAKGVFRMMSERTAEFAQKILISHVDEDGKFRCEMPLDKVRHILAARKWRPVRERIDALIPEAQGAELEVDDDGRVNFRGRKR